MATLAERCKEAGLSSAAELTRITSTSKETLTNWMKDKPMLFEVVLQGAVQVEKYIVSKRFIQLFEKHGVHRNQIPEFFGHGLTFSDVDDYKKLLEKLTPEILNAACELFRVRVQWLQGVDNTVYEIHDFYKQPQSYAEFLSELLNDKEHRILAKLIISTDAYDAEFDDSANAVLILEQEIGYIHNESIQRYHVCGNWDIRYWKCKADLTACIAMTLKNGIKNIRGREKSDNIAVFCRGEGFMKDLYELPDTLERDGLFKKKLPHWQPDDWIYKTESFLKGIDEGKLGKYKAIERWLYYFDKGYLETGYSQKDARAEFALALEKYR